MDCKGSVAVNVIKLYVQMLSNCSSRAPELLIDTLIKNKIKNKKGNSEGIGCKYMTNGFLIYG
jgi:hypothetical protein